MQLMHLVYSSLAQIGNNSELYQPQIDQIVESARELNTMNNITGYLLFDGIEFAQILEGEEGSVMGTFLRIASDRKHSDINVISRGPISERRFEGWKMGLSVRGQAIENIFLKNDFIKPGQMSLKPIESVLRLAIQLSRSVSPCQARA